MAIDFTAFTGNTQPTEVTPTQAGISLNLDKSNFLNLEKVEPGLTHVDMAAGWDTSVAGPAYDLDIANFLVWTDGKIHSANDVIFYNNKTAPGVTLLGDNRTGQGDGDDETIQINLNEVPANIQKIVCTVTIDKAVEKGQTFGMVNNSYVRLINRDTGRELCKFELKDNFSTETAIVFAELVRNDNGWTFHTIGQGKQADLNGLASLFQ